MFQVYCEGAINVLNSRFEATKVLRHNTTAGSVREQIIKDFLVDHLPELISVVSGQIVDADGNFSKQQDIVLISKSVPRLPFASAQDLIFQEGVVATFEVKTTLNAHVIKNIGENIRSTRNLKPCILTVGAIGITHNWPLTRILTVIITYGGVSQGVLDQTLSFLDDDSKPDLVLDFSKGLLVRNHALLLPKRPDLDYIFIDNAGEGFKMFLTFLTEITGILSSRGIQWREYW